MLSFFLHLFEQNHYFNYLSLLLTISLLLFLFTWLSEPRRLLNGILATVFISFLLTWLTVVVFATHLKALIDVYELVVLVLTSLLFLTVAFSWLFFLWNAYFVWQRESHTLPNLLTLILGLLLVIAWGITLLGPDHYLPAWLNTLLLTAPLIALYLILVMYNFLVNLLLYQFVPRNYNQDYLIVLGAGLWNGKIVTPLLANRINRAIQFAQKQVAKGRAAPKLIMSGGQGPDEKIPEAQAMATYARQHGVKADKLLLEERSHNTYENMVFSRRIAREDFGRRNYKIKFVTNNYHTLRAGLCAKKAHLAANGVSAYTRFYFLPNAIIREFAGVFIMHKQRHFIIIGLICSFSILEAILVASGLLQPFI